MNIYIPTYRRVHDQKTWHTLAPEIRQHITFVVRPDEAEEIARLYAPSKIAILPPERCNGINGAMQHIFDIATGPFIYADDDLTALSSLLRFKEHLTWEEENRVRKARWAAKALSTAEEQLELLNAMLETVMEPNVAAASPMPAYVPKLERLISYPSIRRHGQLCACFTAFNPALIKQHGIKWSDCGDSAIGDVYFNCQLLHAGLDCIWLSKWSAANAPMFSGGGIVADSGTREARLAKQIADHYPLVDLFPEMVKLRKIGGGRFGGKHKKDRSNYFDVPVTFYRLDYLRKRRAELDLPPLNDAQRVPADYLAFEDHEEDWRDFEKEAA